MTTDPEEALVRDRIAQVLESHPPASTSVEDFLRARYDAGLAWTWFPEGYGGLGVAASLQTLADREMVAAGGWNTRAVQMGYMITATPIVQHGSDELRDRFLPEIYAGSAKYCQLFSEPGAGSDLAGLATRAVRDGDEWRVTGQKVWSSRAFEADWGILLARTDPDVAKHNGITMFMIDMHSPGVEVVPLRNMSGISHFSEVFLDDARVPDANRVGEVGEGWRCALTTLTAERVSFTAEFAGAWTPRPDLPMERARALFADRHAGDPARRDELMKVLVTYEVNKLNNARSAALSKHGLGGPEGSVGKLISTLLTQTVANLSLSLSGPDGMLMPGPYPTIDVQERDTSHLALEFLNAPSNTIMGGTSQIQRNNIAERVLGLPADIRVDKGIPWRDVPRNR